MGRKRFEPDLEPTDVIGEGCRSRSKPPLVTAIKSDTERFLCAHSTSEPNSDIEAVPKSTLSERGTMQGL